MSLRTLADRIRKGVPKRLAGPASGRTLPIGADFAARSLNLVQAAPTDGGWRLQAAASLPYPAARAARLASPAALARFVAGALASQPFQGRRVVSALPPSEVKILPLTVHLSQGQSEAQAVAKAAIEQLGVAPGSTVLDYYQVRGADGEGASRQVLVAAAHEPRVLDYLAMLQAARLEPVALDIGPAAIARLLAALHGSDIGQSTMLLNFGSAKSYVRRALPPACCASTASAAARPRARMPTCGARSTKCCTRPAWRWPTNWRTPRCTWPRARAAARSAGCT
jgi:type IV pilus assembly protein PilM